MTLVLLLAALVVSFMVFASAVLLLSVPVLLQPYRRTVEYY